MSMQLDPNQVAAQVIGDRITAVSDFVTQRFKNFSEKTKVTFRIGVSNYLKALYERLSVTKTLLYRERPIELDKIYVEVKVKCGGTILKNGAIAQQIRENRQIILVGTAGSGKSMLMKHLFLRFLRSEKDKLPLFVELRHLNSSTNADILDAVLDASGPTFPFAKDQLVFALKQGIIAFFFDGFDEVNYDQRDGIAKEILKIATDYPENLIVVSSRPDETFGAWTPFHTYEVLAFEKKQTIELVRKLEYDDEVKEKFASEIEKQLFDRHREFLSNPLLATMMLLTYDQFADIPSKIHVFYQQAFETLFQKHDALKSVYKRKIYSGLAIDEFKKFFACFCALSYFAEKFAFTDDEARGFVKNALEVSGVGANVQDCLRDMQESVCVLQRDGLRLTFVHRSFQEYFTSYFIVTLNADHAGKYLDFVARRRRGRDSVTAMAFDMNRDIVEAQWVIPTLKEIGQLIGSDENDCDVARVLEAAFETVIFTQLPKRLGSFEISTFVSGNPIGLCTAALAQLYDWQVWPTAAEKKDSFRRDTEVALGLISGEIAYVDASKEFDEYIRQRRAKLKSKKPVVARHRAFMFGASAWREPTNRKWLERTSAADVARAVWRKTSETSKFVEKRCEARKQMLIGITGPKEST